MSFKYQIENVSPGKYVLPFGKVPITIFMTQSLLDESEELLWQEVVTIAGFPGVVEVVVTPDAHASGNGVPVGVVVKTDGSIIIPCAAGYDISCGMGAAQMSITLDTAKDRTRRRKWMDAVIQRMALGAGKHQAPKQRRITDNLFKEILVHGATAITGNNEILKNLERKNLPVDTAHLPFIDKAQRGLCQLGSLGSGNHFATMEVDQFLNMWSLFHTGSRGYGHGTAEYFFEKGAEALGLAKSKKELAYFETNSVLGKQYIACMNAAANFAIANRLIIFEAIQEATAEVYGAEAKLFYEISHNLVQEEDGALIHRKGATRAFPAGHPALMGTKWEATGHPILIPGSMGTESAILFARENSRESLYSVNHGCGRVLSRNSAKKQLAALQQDIDTEMDRNDIIINTRSTPLDECKYVYKDIKDVLDAVTTSRLAEVAYMLSPKAVIKGE